MAGITSVCTATLCFICASHGLELRSSWLDQQVLLPSEPSPQPTFLSSAMERARFPVCPRSVFFFFFPQGAICVCVVIFTALYQVHGLQFQLTLTPVPLALASTDVMQQHQLERIRLDTSFLWLWPSSDVSSWQLTLSNFFESLLGNCLASTWKLVLRVLFILPERS